MTNLGQKVRGERGAIVRGRGEDCGMTLLSAGAGGPPLFSFQEVWVVSIGHALTHWYPATFYLLLPLIGAELGLSYSQIGSILTCPATAGGAPPILLAAAGG